MTGRFISVLTRLDCEHVPLGSRCEISEVIFSWNKRCDVIARNETTDRIYASALGRALRNPSTRPGGPVTAPSQSKHNSWVRLAGHRAELFCIP